MEKTSEKLQEEVITELTAACQLKKHHVQHQMQFNYELEALLCFFLKVICFKFK